MEVTLNLTKFVTLNEELSGEIFPSFLSIEEFIYLGICYNMKSDEPFCMKPPLTIDYEKLETLGFIKITQDIVYLRDRAMGLFGKQSDDILELTKKFRELFPASIRTGGYLVKSSESDIANKLRKFMKNYKNVTQEQILEATRRFVARKRQEGWQYMKTASYFIYKDNESVLAAEIENLQQAPTEPKSSNLNKML